MTMRTTGLFPITAHLRSVIFILVFDGSLQSAAKDSFDPIVPNNPIPNPLIDAFFRKFLRFKDLSFSSFLNFSNCFFMFNRVWWNAYLINFGKNNTVSTM